MYIHEHLDNDIDVVLNEKNLYTFQIDGRSNGGGSNTSDSSVHNFSDWTRTKLKAGNFEVIPYGKDNKLDKQLQDTIFPNHLAPRILTKKAFLLWGTGPTLYKLTPEGKNIVREYVEDSKIEEWLYSFDIEKTLLNSITDYYYTESCFQKIIRKKGSRLGLNTLPEIEHISFKKCRLAYRKSDKRKKATHVVVGDWENGNSNDFKVYPLFDPFSPDKYPISIAYNFQSTFGMDDYAMPDLYGSLASIKRSTSIPYIIEAYTKNSINIKYHITSPARFWEKKRDQLKKFYEAKKQVYKEKYLDELKSKILKTITDLLSDVDNVGKIWHSELIIETLGGKQIEHGWKITPIDQKIKEFVDAQLKIGTHFDFNTVAGLGLHSALANVGADGKSDSGSEQLYALKNHLLTETNIPEMIVCKTINQLIKYFFKTKIKLGFYQSLPEREEDLSSENRIKNN
ncbi:hypothetical protein [Aureivirga marina]|uniref:hypothetical protein n=1 Tax=Aureivirga marina TaxID=1182451 RepID=UPI0018C9DD69|nr:hypothetical protein [Aureivirga marina]